MLSIDHWWVLTLLPAPLLVYYIMGPLNSINSSALKVPFIQRLQQLSVINNVLRENSWWKIFLQAMLWFLLVIAASNPLWVGKSIAIDRSGRDLLLAVDISGSMEIPDMQWKGESAQRLDVVKNVAHQFINDRKGDRVGLILFGTQAYLQSPLTFDKQTVTHMLDDASVGLAGPRTAIGDAIGLAIKRLKDSKQEKKVLVLLTDGASNAGRVKALDAAEMAAKYGIRIYTVGLGATELVLPGVFGSQIINPSADLDESTLHDIASKTGGLYFRATNSEELKKIYNELDKVEPVASDEAFFRPQAVLYPYLLVIILATLFLLSFFHKLSRDRKQEKYYESIR